VIPIQGNPFYRPTLKMRTKMDEIHKKKYDVTLIDGEKRVPLEVVIDGKYIHINNAKVSVSVVLANNQLMVYTKDENDFTEALTLLSDVP
jgi:hypothetical protein